MHMLNKEQLQTLLCNFNQQEKKIPAKGETLELHFPNATDEGHKLATIKFMNKRMYSVVWSNDAEYLARQKPIKKGKKKNG